MPKSPRKRAGAKAALVLLSAFLFLLLFATAASALTMGDINDDGAINVQDVVLVMQHVLGIDDPPLTDAQKTAADVNGDGDIDVQDVTLIMQKSLNIIDEFPYEEPVDLEVSSARAINPKQVEVVFNRALSAEEKGKMVAANFHVGLQASPLTDRLTGVINDGSAVQVQEDNKTVLLTMANNFHFADPSVNNRLVVRKAVGLDADYVRTNLGFMDAEVPTLVSAESIGPRTIALTFSEPLDRTRTPANILLDGGTIGLNLASPTYIDAQRQLRIDASADLASGTHTIAILSNNNLRDYSGYPVVPAIKTFTHTPITTPPAISIKESTERTVTIQFERVIDKNTLVGNTRALFRHTYNTPLYQADGTSITNPSGDSKTFVIDFGTRLLPPGDTSMWFNYADGTTDAQKVKDTWGNIVPPQAFTVTTVPDTTAPTATVSVVPDSNRIIEIRYSEPVQGALDSANYVLKKGASIIPFTGPVLHDEATNKYRITAVDPMQGEHTLTISNIKDKSIAENLMPATTFTFDVPDTIPPQVVNTAGVPENVFYWQATNNRVRVFFSEPMKKEDLENKTLYQNVADANANPTVATASADGKSVYLEFDNNVTGQLRVGALRDLAGNSLGFQTLLNGVAATRVGLDPAITPAENRVVATATTTVKFYLNDLVLNATTSDFQVFSDGSWRYPVALSNDTSSGKSVITLTLDSNHPLAHDAAAAQLRTVTAGGVFGDTANARNLYGIPVRIAATAVTDRIVPVLADNPVRTMDVDQNGKIDHIRIEFKEAMQDLFVNPDRFTVSGYTVVDAYTATTPPTSATSRAGATVGDARFIYLRVTEKAVPDTGVTPTVTIESGLRDLAGNVFAGATRTALDRAAPVMVSAVTRSANTIEITYSETVTNNNLAPTQYVFDIDGLGGLPPDVTTNITVSGNKLIITLSTGGLSSGTSYPAATITYTQSPTAANRTKDAATNDAVSPQTLTGVTSGF